MIQSPSGVVIAGVVTAAVLLPLLTSTPLNATQTGEPSETTSSNNIRSNNTTPNRTKPTLTKQNKPQAIETITIVAQKQLQNLQHVPLAVTALSDEQLDKSLIRELTDIETRVPGMAMGTFNLGQPQIYMRGIGSNADGAGSDSSISVFLDEVYIGRTAGSALDFYDIDQIEVLRGPQGTLWGKNVIGGALSIQTRQPSPDFYFKGSAGVGNLDSRTLQLAVNGSLSETTYANVAFSQKNRDGYVDTAIMGPRIGDQDINSGRFRLFSQLTDVLELNISADLSHTSQFGPAHVPSSGQIDDAHRASSPKSGNDFYTTFGDITGRQQLDNDGIMARLEYFHDAGTLTSISAYRESDYQMTDSILGSNIELFPVNIIQQVADKSRQWSQELRFATPAQQQLSWVAGIYFINQDINRLEATDLTLGPPFTGSPGNQVSHNDSIQDNRTKSYALFGQLDYVLSDRLTLALGSRYTYEKKEIRQQSIGLIPTFSSEEFDISTDADFEALTPRIALDYQHSDQLMMYASIARGFKSGGFQGSAPTELIASTPYEQELAVNYELGLKSQWLDNHLRLNAVGFFTDYSDLQILEQLDSGDLGLGPQITSNAAEASSQGVELEWVWQPGQLSSLNISGSYAYLDARFDSFRGRPELKDNYLRNAPRHSYHLSVNYDIDLANGSYITAFIENRYKDRTYQEPDNLPGSAIPGYHISNAKLSYNSTTAGWRLSLWTNNLFDKKYLIHNFATPTSSGDLAVLGMPGPPRTFGISLSWQLE